MADLDDILNDLLGDLNDLTMQLEASNNSVSNSAPPPPPVSMKPAYSPSSFPPPPPPAVKVNFPPPLNFPAPPPPPPASMKPVPAVNVNYVDSDFLPPPPMEVTSAAQDQEDLTAMLDDLAIFTDDIAQDFATGTLPRNGQLHTPAHDVSQQFGTLRRTGASYVQPGYGDDDDDDVTDGADLTLDSLARDIEVSKEEDSMPSEAELANLSPEEREEKLKSERMRIALEKLKEARIQKLVVKVYNEDQSSKTMMIDERMTTRAIVKQLLEKNHFDFSPDWTMMEEFPSLYMERMFEEHEKPCDFLSYWTRDSTNQIRLLERKDKYALFKTPQRYLLPPTDAQDRMQERQKQSLIEEFFSGGGSSSLVPEVQGWLNIKGDSKSWSRKYCVLRSSGLYVSKSGEPKKGKKLSDLSSLVMFEHTQLYHGRGWKKKFKSPFDYGFALKHPSIQVKSKQIKYLCCEDFSTYMTWTVGIRLAKNGKLLLENYQKTQEDLKSTSVVTSHLAMRQQQAESQARKMSSHDAEVPKLTTPARPVGVKSIFEGAWQRAEEGEDTIHARPPTTRQKSVYNPTAASQRSGSDWWSLKSDHEGIPSKEPVAAPEVYIPPPPPTTLAYQQQQPPPPAVHMPPPPPPSNYQQAGFDLPPPPDAMFSNYSNNNSGSLKVRKNSNGNNNNLSRFSSPDDSVAPPSFQPPPPPKKKSLTKKPWGQKKQQQRAPVVGGAMAPLASYYSTAKPTENFKIDDFPPPPPFLLDLKDSFREAAKTSSRLNEELLIKNLPPPPNAVLSVINRTTAGRRQAVDSGSPRKPPPPAPPQRSATTKLSFSGRHSRK